MILIFDNKLNGKINLRGKCLLPGVVGSKIITPRSNIFYSRIKFFYSQILANKSHHPHTPQTHYLYVKKKKKKTNSLNHKIYQR